MSSEKAWHLWSILLLEKQASWSLFVNSLNRCPNSLFQSPLHFPTMKYENLFEANKMLERKVELMAHLS